MLVEYSCGLSAGSLGDGRPSITLDHVCVMRHEFYCVWMDGFSLCVCVSVPMCPRGGLMNTEYEVYVHTVYILE